MNGVHSTLDKGMRVAIFEGSTMRKYIKTISNKIASIENSITIIFCIFLRKNEVKKTIQVI
jgi:hypothetical protein